MRLVSWNVSRQGRNALAALVAQLSPDVAVINEFGAALAEPPPGAATWNRFGSGPYRSQVATFRQWRAEALALPELRGCDAAAYRVTGPLQFDLIGVWAGYRASVHEHVVVEAVQRWGPSLGPVRVVAGDFNSTSVNDLSGDRSHAAVVESLLGWGLQSAYHRSTGVTHGDEPDWTYRSVAGSDVTSHIDYVFVPASWHITCAVVSVDGIRSDHRAVVVDVVDDVIAYSDVLPATST